MSNVDDEKPFIIKPGRPRAQNETIPFTRAFRSVLAETKRLIQAAKPKRASRGWPNKHQQRCVVKLAYSKNRRHGPQANSGQWKAHGRYISRRSATGTSKGVDVGFDEIRDDVNPPELLDGWQTAGDRRMFKIVISPEFGAQADLKKLTRDLMSQMEHDLKSELQWAKLEWVAEVHRNTDNPHVHVALRGVAGGNEFRIPKDYVRCGIRRHAQDYCTRQMGYRPREDPAVIAARRARIIQQQSTQPPVPNTKGGQQRP